MARHEIVGVIVALALIAAPDTTRQSGRVGRTPSGLAALAAPPALTAVANWTGAGSFYYVRAAPSDTASPVGQIARGTALLILAGTPGTVEGGNPWWYRVRVGQTTGYVSSTAIATVGATTLSWVATATSDGDPSVTEIAARRAPLLTAPVAALYPLGARFTVSGQVAGAVAEGDDAVWYRVAQGPLPPVYLYSTYLKFAAWGRAAPAVPLLTAASAVAIDGQSGRTLTCSACTRRWSPASTVKIMTALVALAHLPPSARLRVPADVQSVTTEVGGSSMGLLPGETLPLSDLLYGLLLPSGNDAACTIAQGVAGSQDGFALMMNAMAVHLGLRDTHYTNPTGLDAPREYTSAADLAALARDVLRRVPLIATIVRTPAYTINVGPGHPAFALRSLDQLLGAYPGAEGVKTGTTAQAGENLVAAATRDHHQVLAVVLGSSDRYADATALLDHAFAASGYPPARPAFGRSARGR